jgi:hypothetical protein
MLSAGICPILDDDTNSLDALASNIGKGMVIRIRPEFSRAAALGAVVLLTNISTAAQTPSEGSHLEFEVASVKRVEPPAPAHAVGLNITPGRVLIEAATLRMA